MIHDALLSVPIARAIARKGITRVGGVASSFAARMWGQFGVLDDISGTPDGFAFDYVAETEFGFPSDSGPYGFRRYGDSRGISEGRLVVNVVEAGPSDSSLSVRIEDGSFGGGAPSCPLDAVGLYVSGWEPLVLPASPTPDNSALLSWVVENPSSSLGSARVGTCQLQVR